ncbi:MAG: hypothetical protein QOG69_926 [Actinomycetota bacterium]|nr:hypothetical protein [Actinomycetota bacterium]
MVAITERPADHALAILRKRVQSHLNPFFAHAETEESLTAIDSVTEPASDAWASAFLALANTHAGHAHAYEAQGDPVAATQAWASAYDYGHIARYPYIDTALKREAHTRSVEYFKKAHELSTDLEHVTVASAIGPLQMIFRRPPTEASLPLIICVGGLDVWKEELIAVVLKPYVAAGFAVLALDGPGTGESPVSMAPVADAMWDAVLDWANQQPALSGFRAVLGTSLGGYWATRVAHTHATRISAAVNHGGPAHYTFSDAWFDHWVDRGEYPCGFAKAFQSVTRTADAAELTARFHELSLLEHAVLDRPCAPLLLVNGAFDRTIDPADMELLLRHGSPKTARFFPTGHMGFTPTTVPTIVSWLQSQVQQQTQPGRVRA